MMIPGVRVRSPEREGERGICLTFPVSGRGAGRVGPLPLVLGKRQSGFVPLPRRELLYLCVLTHAQERVRTAKPAQRVEGRMPGVKEKVAKEKEHPDTALSGHPALRVREAWPGLSAGPPARSKRHCPPWRCPLRGLVVPTSPPHRGPGKAARSCAQKQQPEQSEAPRDSAPSVSRYGAVWPPRGSCRREWLQHPRHNTVCSSGGLNQAISLGYFS